MNLNLIALFSLGAFFSFLSYLVTTLEDKGINKDNYKAVLLVLFFNGKMQKNSDPEECRSLSS